MDASNAADPALVRKRLSEISCNSAVDLEFFEAGDYDNVIELMKPGVLKKKLLKLLNR